MIDISMNGLSKVCEIFTIKSKVYIDPIGLNNVLWSLWLPQRNLALFYYLSFKIVNCYEIDLTLNGFILLIKVLEAFRKNDQLLLNVP